MSEARAELRQLLHLVERGGDRDLESVGTDLSRLSSGQVAMQVDADDPSPTLSGASPAQHEAGLETKDRIDQDDDDRNARCSHAAAWVGTQLRVFAVAGLSSLHAEPFVRVLFHLPASQTHKTRAETRTLRVISLDNEGAECRRRRDPNGRYTAVWEERTPSKNSTGRLRDEDHDGESAFALPPALQHVEIQVWNRFPNGFDVFLGATTVAIKSLRRQLLSEQQDEDDQTPTSASTGILRAPAAWYLLSSDSDHTGRTQRLQLSVQLDVRFISDPRAFAIRQKIACETVAERLRRDGSSTDDPNDPKQAKQQHIADPAFAFVNPFQAIDWSVIVSTSLRHIFFHVRVAERFG